jgi:MoaA/NifB/PqqE/SkfB family radical SAM enzyme
MSNQPTTFAAAVTSLRRRAAAIADDARVLAKLVPALADPYRPLMAHVVVTRRCNLACGYCHEYDHESAPVPLATMLERLDHLARLRTVFVTLTGGEALLHPDIVAIVRAVRARGMVPAMNTNGYLLTRARIDELNAAGLFAMQLSIDAVEAGAVTVKALRPLRKKLALLAAHARFRVRINTVLGTGAPEEAVTVAREVKALGFDAKCSLVRDGRGKVAPVDAAARAAYDEIDRLGRRAPSYLSEDFQRTLIDRGTVEWKCRAGARYFTVCEDGLVHLCESSFGSPGTPLASYTDEDLRTWFHRRKACAPTCAVAYAHQASRVDALRPQDAVPTSFPKQAWRAPALVQLRRDRTSADAARAA